MYMYVCTYVRMYQRTDGHLRPALLGRLCRRVDLIIVEFSFSVFTFDFRSCKSIVKPVLHAGEWWRHVMTTRQFADQRHRPLLSHNSTIILT